MVTIVAFLQQAVQKARLFNRIAQLETAVNQLQQENQQIMADLTNLGKVVSQVATDFTKLKTDFEAYLAANPPADPAQQATIDALTASLQTVDSGIQTMDATLNPPPPAQP